MYNEFEINKLGYESIRYLEKKVTIVEGHSADMLDLFREYVASRFAWP